MKLISNWTKVLTRRHFHLVVVDKSSAYHTNTLQVYTFPSVFPLQYCSFTTSSKVRTRKGTGSKPQIHSWKIFIMFKNNTQSQEEHASTWQPESVRNWTSNTVREATVGQPDVLAFSCDSSEKESINLHKWCFIYRKNTLACQYVRVHLQHLMWA